MNIQEWYIVSMGIITLGGLAVFINSFDGWALISAGLAFVNAYGQYQLTGFGGKKDA
jgi:hypothetical protein